MKCPHCDQEMIYMGEWPFFKPDRIVPEESQHTWACRSCPSKGNQMIVVRKPIEATA